jgi:hypothetical protein
MSEKVEIINLLKRTIREGNRQKTRDKAKRDAVSMRGWNLSAVRLTAVQVTKQPLRHMPSKRGLVCSTQPGQTEAMYVTQYIC